MLIIERSRLMNFSSTVIKFPKYEKCIWREELKTVLWGTKAIIIKLNLNEN